MIESHMHSDLNARKWNVRAETYDKRRFDYMRFMQNRTIKLITIRYGISLLDIGCGTGWAVRKVAKLADREGTFCGIDISPRMIEKAMEQIPEGWDIQFQIASAEKLPFFSAKFDVVLCTNSFHHYKNPAKVLLEIKRVLKPNGIIYITDLTTDSYVAKMIDNRQRKREPEHIKFYNSLEYKKMFSEAGIIYLKAMTIALTMMKVHIGKVR
jgi:ubiquinone/menaquinone biosynthesis C-methylase UbiE